MAMRRAPSSRSAATRAATYAHVVTMPVPPDGWGTRLAEIDQESRRIAAGRCGRWTSTSPDRLHVGFVEAAHRDAFVLWLTLSGIEFG